MDTRKRNDVHSESIHLYERYRRIFVDVRDSRRDLRKLKGMRVGAERNRLRA